MEIKGYIKLALGRSLEKTLGKLLTHIGSFTCFLVVGLTSGGSELSNAKIFSTLDLMATLRIVVVSMGISLGFYFELKIIFGRFCTILNIDDKRMIKIDPQTKEPF